MILALFLTVTSMVNGSCDSTGVKLMHLTVDNDAFLFSQIDQYYSSGILFRIGWTGNKATIKSGLDDRRVVNFAGINHQIYTPIRFNSPFLIHYDRPHAGLLTFDFKKIVAKQSNLFYWQGSVGWMGPKLNTGQMLEWWHNILDYKRPRGWLYEISDTPILQLGGGFIKAIVKRRSFDSNFGLEGNFGTVFNFISMNSDIRIGRILPINHSMLYNLSLNESKEKKKIQEFYLIAGMKMNYVIYNASIQGNMIGEASLHTEDIEPWVYQSHTGLGISTGRFGSQITYNHRSSEVVGAKKHDYISIKLNYRL